MAHTSNKPRAGANAHHKIRLQAKHLSSTRTLPDLPGNDYLENKGDLWKLHLKDFFGFTTCITITDIQEISILQGNNDEWNIESIVTFAVVSQSEWEMTSADFNVFEWIDGDSAEAYKEFTLSLRPSTGQCIHFLYVMVYTSSQANADGGADSVHRIEFQAKGAIRTEVLPNLPGDDYLIHKGDLWKLNIETYFGLSGCINKHDIEGIAILAGGNDGWDIDSIVTYVAVNEHNWELSSVDLDADRWVDGDSSDTFKRFDLSLVV